MGDCFNDLAIILNRDPLSPREIPIPWAPQHPPKKVEKPPGSYSRPYCLLYGSFSKLGIPLIIRTIVFWGPYWGPLILENYHIAILW